ncbi:P-loop NTPase family protein [Pseudooceanicola sp. 502str34]|uniref:adenylate kinase n=1 Tax=Maritimibacter alkaliphilus TaxID=404236 RepID=UPI001C974D99|nr:adenylate kinase [Maritimibacter alkaliphilus]MBY6089205.1 adenylate kinase [Maritimibacter alkaliphilus]
MSYEPRIYLTGAACSGVTTLGRGLAETWNVRHLDVDDYFWLPTDPPYTRRRPVLDRIRAIEADMGQGGWVISGSFDGWGDPLIAEADLIVFLCTATHVRLARLDRRERARFGARLDPGGDMHDIHVGFRDWAARYDDPAFHGRSRYRHELWLLQQDCPVLRLNGGRSLSRLVSLASKALTLEVPAAAGEIALFKSLPGG